MHLLSLSVPTTSRRELWTEWTGVRRTLDEEARQEERRRAAWPSPDSRSSYRASLNSHDAASSFDRYLSLADTVPADVARQIDLDVTRTFPPSKVGKGRGGGRGVGGVGDNEEEEEEEEAGGGSEQERASLRRVLLALAVAHPDIGYTQSMNFLAGTSLIFLTEEETFHLVSYIITVVLPDTFRPDLLGTFVDADILSQLLKLECPDLAAHFASVGIELPMITSKWFMTLFLLNFPTETALCLWDAIFANGPVVIFQVALRVLKLAEATLLDTDDPFAIIVRLSEGTARGYEAADLLIGTRAPPLFVTIDNGTLAILRKVGRERLQAKVAEGVARRAARAAQMEEERALRQSNDEGEDDDDDEDDDVAVVEVQGAAAVVALPTSKTRRPLPPKPLPPPPPPPANAMPAPLAVSDAQFEDAWE